MMRSKYIEACSVMKINFRFVLPAYIVTAALFSVGIYNIIACLTGATDNFYVDMANYIYIFAVLSPIIIVSRSFKRIMCLNGSKKGFFWGTLLTYCVSSAVISLICILFFVVTNFALGSQLIIQSFVNIFGWWKNGVIIAFIQQFSFLLLVQIFFHVLTSIQSRWYGWVVDALIAIVLCVFLPVPELRSLIVKFFNVIIFNKSAILQIASCLTLSNILYFLYVPIIRRKEV